MYTRTIASCDTSKSASFAERIDGYFDFLRRLAGDRALQQEVEKPLHQRGAPEHAAGADAVGVRAKEFGVGHGCES